jgi:beta-phosphoglucomutase-like phosphatase (HAD superfamily)
MLVEAAVRINRRDFDAAIFDLDGVLTDTAGVHAAAWKTVFDAFLQRWAEQYGRAFQPFDIHSDYLAYVDGRPRYDGVRSFSPRAAYNFRKDRSMTVMTRRRSARSVIASRNCFDKS